MLIPDFINWLSGFLDASEGGLTPTQTARVVSRLQSTMVKVTPDVPNVQLVVSENVDMQSNNDKLIAAVRSMTSAQWIAASAYMTRTPFGVSQDIASILQSESNSVL